MDLGRHIGRNGKLPWRLPSDLRRFRALTEGKAVVMGRRTYESIGKPLPRRVNVLLSRTAEEPPGFRVARSMRDALAAAARDTFLDVVVIGGARPFEEALPIADTIHLTVIDGFVGGDVKFPRFDLRAWDLETVVRVPLNEQDMFTHDYAVLRRRAQPEVREDFEEWPLWWRVLHHRQA